MAVNRHPRPRSQGMVKEGARNDTLFKQAPSMRGAGQTASEILDSIRVENESRCHPPLPDREVQTIANSACSYPPGGSSFFPFSSSPLKGGGRKRKTV
jgi:hypothetical protein